MTARSTVGVLRSLGRPRVVVVGDVVLDRYVRGRVDRISPEAPIQVLRVESTTERLGAAAFAATAAASLGASVCLIGVVGTDDAGQRVHALAAEADIDAVLLSESERVTTLKTRHIAHSHVMDQQVLRVDEETPQPLAPETARELVDQVAHQAQDADIVLINDYGKGTLDGEWLQDIIGRKGCPVIVDPYKGRYFSRYAGATGITPNRAELGRATGMPVTTMHEVTIAAKNLIRTLGLEYVLATLDRDGMLLYPRLLGVTHIATTPREVFDVTGAGDTVLSTFGVALASGASPEEAATLANVAAGLQVEHVGVRPLTRDDLLARLHSTGQAPRAKRVAAADLAALGDRLRALGRRIVFTNGCFDLLHAGHVSYLTEAKALGDVLVVGVNSDDSVRVLKGPTRPVTSLHDRLLVLSGLASVDHVVAFSTDTPLTLIEALRPDVLVKGADWRDRGVVGREFVESYGGSVRLIELLKGRSTSELLARITHDASGPLS